VSADRVLPDPEAEPTISVARAARILGVSPKAIYLGVDSGAVAGKKLGRRVFILTAAFLRTFGLTEEETP
jgi:hypothetical protein